MLQIAQFHFEKKMKTVFDFILGHGIIQTH